MHNHANLFRKRAVAGFAPAAMFMLTWPLAAQVDLGLSPMRIEFGAIPGRPYSGVLSLTNSGPEKSRVRAELLDFYVDENTTPQFVANSPTESAYSCRTWLSANPMEMEVEAHGQVTVRYTVRVPMGASERGYHCALGFRTLPAAGDGAGTQIRTAVRMIAVVYATVGKPATSGVIKDLKLEPVTDPSGTIWRAVVIMENSGMVLYRPTGQLEIADSGGKVIESQKLAPFPALPERQQRYVLPLKSNLNAGQYTLKASIEVGGEIQEASVVVVAAAHVLAAPTTETPPQ
jgi:hypothetical protein